MVPVVAVLLVILGVEAVGGVEVAVGAMRVEIAAATETSEIDEMTLHHSETTVVGNAIEIGGIVTETRSGDGDHRRAPEDRHPAEISATATFK